MLAASHLAAAEDKPLSIRPVQIISQAEVPAGAPREASSVQFNKGFTIGYLVEGEGIIGFDKRSLTIEHILLPGGKDIAKKRNGKDNFEFGSFPEVSDNGKFGFFQLQSEEFVFGQAEALVVQGSIGVRTASELKTVASKPHPPASNESEVVDEFAVTFGPGPKQDKMPRFLMDSYKDKTPIVVAGPLAKISEIRLLIADKEVKSDEYTSAESGPRTYFFSKSDPATPVTLRIKYWKDLKVVTVPFPRKAP